MYTYFMYTILVNHYLLDSSMSIYKTIVVCSMMSIQCYDYIYYIRPVEGGGCDSSYLLMYVSIVFLLCSLYPFVLIDRV